MQETSTKGDVWENMKSALLRWAPTLEWEYLNNDLRGFINLVMPALPQSEARTEIMTSLKSLKSPAGDTRPDVGRFLYLILQLDAADEALCVQCNRALYRPDPVLYERCFTDIRDAWLEGKHYAGCGLADSWDVGFNQQNFAACAPKWEGGGSSTALVNVPYTQTEKKSLYCGHSAVELDELADFADSNDKEFERIDVALVYFNERDRVKDAYGRRMFPHEWSKLSDDEKTALSALVSSYGKFVIHQDVAGKATSVVLGQDMPFVRKTYALGLGKIQQPLLRTVAANIMDCKDFRTIVKNSITDSRSLTANLGAHITPFLSENYPLESLHVVLFAWTNTLKNKHFTSDASNQKLTNMFVSSLYEMYLTSASLYDRLGLLLNGLGESVGAFAKLDDVRAATHMPLMTAEKTKYFFDLWLGNWDAFTKNAKFEPVDLKNSKGKFLPYEKGWGRLHPLIDAINIVIVLSSHTNVAFAKQAEKSGDRVKTWFAGAIDEFLKTARRQMFAQIEIMNKRVVGSDPDNNPYGDCASSIFFAHDITKMIDGEVNQAQLTKPLLKYLATLVANIDLFLQFPAADIQAVRNTILIPTYHMPVNTHDLVDGWTADLTNKIGATKLRLRREKEEKEAKEVQAKKQKLEPPVVVPSKPESAAAPPKRKHVALTPEQRQESKWSSQFEDFKDEVMRTPVGDLMHHTRIKNYMGMVGVATKQYHTLIKELDGLLPTEAAQRLLRANTVHIVTHTARTQVARAFGELALLAEPIPVAKQRLAQLRAFYDIDNDNILLFFHELEQFRAGQALFKDEAARSALRSTRHAGLLLNSAFSNANLSKVNYLEIAAASPNPNPAPRTLQRDSRHVSANFTGFVLVQMLRKSFLHVDDLAGGLWQAVEQAAVDVGTVVDCLSKMLPTYPLSTATMRFAPVDSEYALHSERILGAEEEEEEAEKEKEEDDDDDNLFDGNVSECEYDAGEQFAMSSDLRAASAVLDANVRAHFKLAEEQQLSAVERYEAFLRNLPTNLKDLVIRSGKYIAGRDMASRGLRLVIDDLSQEEEEEEEAEEEEEDEYEDEGEEETGGDLEAGAMQDEAEIEQTMLIERAAGNYVETDRVANEISAFLEETKQTVIRLWQQTDVAMSDDVSSFFTDLFANPGFRYIHAVCLDIFTQYTQSTRLKPFVDLVFYNAHNHVYDQYCATLYRRPLLAAQKYGVLINTVATGKLALAPIKLSAAAKQDIEQIVDTFNAQRAADVAKKFRDVCGFVNIDAQLGAVAVADRAKDELLLAALWAALPEKDKAMVREHIRLFVDEI